MVNFDKFEQNVKNNYGNQEFPFDEQNWEKARKMIDASRQGKNRGGIFLLSAVAILCTTGLVYYFGFSDSTKPLEKNNLAVNETAAPKNNDQVVTDMKPENTRTENNIQASVENTSENKVTESKNTVASNINSGSDNTSKAKTITKTSSETSSANKTEAVNTTSSEKNTKAEEKINSNPANTSNETKTESSKNTDAKKPAQTKSNTQKATPPVLGNNSDNTNNEIKPVTPVVNTNVGGNSDKLGDTENNSTPQTTPVKNNPSIATDSLNHVVTATVKPTASSVDSLPKISKGRADSLAAMMPDGDGVSYATNVKEKHNAKNILFVEAGTTYMLGWGGGANNDANGFNLLGGLNFQHYFTGTLAAQIGAQYSTVANLTHTSHTISTVKYDLGVEQDITSIKYQTLHYLVAPIKFTYTLKDNNIFGIGCNVAYLLNSNSKKEKYKTYSSDPNATKNNLTSTKETGYMQGFNPYDIQLAVSYRRKIYKGLSANAEFFYGLTDTKNNSFFKSNQFDRNVGFKVSLCYDLFKK